jgi:ABC-type Fe3+-siderophore transport system permease subunit
MPLYGVGGTSAVDVASRGTPPTTSICAFAGLATLLLWRRREHDYAVERRCGAGEAALHLRQQAIVALGITVPAIAGFLLADTQGYADFVVPLRVRRLVALVLVGWAIALSTVLFQTVTGNRILTPALMGFDALYVLVQTVVVFAFSAQLLRDTDPRLHGAAGLSVLAHLEDLVARGLVSTDGDPDIDGVFVPVM